MKYLSADLLPKVFHGLMCIMYLSYTYNSYSQPKHFFLPVITAKYMLETLLNNNKPELYCDETHEIPFSRPIAKGISWSHVYYVPIIYL